MVIWQFYFRVVFWQFILGQHDSGAGEKFSRFLFMVERSDGSEGANFGEGGGWGIVVVGS